MCYAINWVVIKCGVNDGVTGIDSHLQQFFVIYIVIIKLLGG